MRLGQLASAVGLVLTSGCGDGSGAGPTDADAGPPTPPADAEVGCVPGPDAAPSGHAAGDVSGTWAVLERVHALVGMPLNSAQLSRQVYLFQITQTGEALAIVERLCDIEVVDTGGLEVTRMLPALWTNLPAVAHAGTLGADGAFATERTYRIRGASLAAPETDPLPTTPDDPRLLDVDADQKPGVTLLLDGILRGQAYVVQRDWNQYYDGRLVGPDRIEARSMWSSEQVYLGSDPASIATLGITAHPDPDPSKHVVLMLRVPDGTDCAALLANQCTLFDGR